MRRGALFAIPAVFAVHSIIYSDLVVPGGPSYTGVSLFHGSAAIYTKYTLDAAAFPLASCLDGGPGAFYVRPGNPNKFRIFFQGGGWCVSDDDCFARSKTDLGSTRGLPATSPDPAGYCGASFLSSDPKVNPTIGDWTAVYVPYCEFCAQRRRATARTAAKAAPTRHPLTSRPTPFPHGQATAPPTRGACTPPRR
jgi:hypothetical protein